MKKNISINISGIIFHIEEDGYDALRKYLDSINQYFGSFEDSNEILADIESRIAEIFLSRLNEGKQVITAEDVQSLIATMGNVNDFKAAEEQEVSSDDQSRQSESSTGSTASESKSRSAGRQLIRDGKRKIMGGVCAGFGHYFNIDPIWPRLLFGLLFFATSGILLLVYFVLWIVLPTSDDLEEQPTVKKMYRNPDSKVVGGVAGGVAAFFGIDVVVVRLLFVLFTIFFGTGLLIYIILWIALPEAKTITEKMKMQGEPVTLSNIESTVKRGLNEKDPGDESTLAKIILFPFRVIAAVIEGIGKVLGPLFYVIVEVFRVAIGIIISLTGFAMIAALVVILGTFLGVFSLSAIPDWGVHISQLSLPMETIRQSFPLWTGISVFAVIFIPALFIMLIGNSILAKRIVFGPLYGWSMFVIFLLCAIFLSFRIPQLIYSFKEESEAKVEKVFALKDKTPVLKIKQVGLDDYDVTDLYLRGYEGSDLKAVERFGAQGITKLNARDNAGMVDYNIEQNDSILTFDSNITFKKDARFSFQRLDIDLYIPYDRPFIIDDELWDLVRSQWRNEYNRRSDLPQTFKFTRGGKMECITCPPPEKDLSGLAENDQLGLKDFDEIDMTGAFNVSIQHGPEFSIQVDGSEDQKHRYTMTVNGGTLEVGYQTSSKNFWQREFRNDEMTTITITMPTLRKLKVTGAGKLRVRGFEETESYIDLTGAMVGDIHMNANQLSVETTGPVILDLVGEGDYLEASVTGPSQFKAANYTVNRALVEARGLGQARVNVRHQLEIDKDFTSNVRYSGNPEIIKHD